MSESNTCLCQGAVGVISGALVITSADGILFPPAHDLVDTESFVFVTRAAALL
jgi:hypothetical protein